MGDRWRDLAEMQCGVLARRQLLALGLDDHYVRHRLRTERWTLLSPVVVATTTGEPTWEQRLWFAVLHCGGESLVGGLSAASRHGLRRWERDEVCVLVDGGAKVTPAPGLRITRTRRPLRELRDPRGELPLCRLEPAVLLHAAYERSQRSAQGLLAACVQQRLTTPERLGDWVARMRPLRRAKDFSVLLTEMSGGVQSVSELDVARMCRRHGMPRPRRQVRRRDSSGRTRFTDCEWPMPGGVVVLEIDGAFHMDVEHWEDDLARQRALTAPGRLVVRATSRELRDDDGRVAHDLIRLGVPGRGSQTAL